MRLLRYARYVCVCMRCLGACMIAFARCVPGLQLLTTHKQPVAQFLEANYDEFMGRYEKCLPRLLAPVLLLMVLPLRRLLLSDNYVTKRVALKLLGEILLDRPNFAIMQR